MGNALDEVKAAADRIAPSHDDDGLVQVVDWLLEYADDRVATRPLAAPQFRLERSGPVAIR